MNERDAFNYQKSPNENLCFCCCWFSLVYWTSNFKVLLTATLTSLQCAVHISMLAACCKIIYYFWLFFCDHFGIRSVIGSLPYKNHRCVRSFSLRSYEVCRNVKQKMRTDFRFTASCSSILRWRVIVRNSMKIRKIVNNISSKLYKCLSLIHISEPTRPY